MRYEIAANILCYETDAVGCFDPTKVMVRLAYRRRVLVQRYLRPLRRDATRTPISG